MPPAAQEPNHVHPQNANQRGRGRSSRGNKSRAVHSEDASHKATTSNLKNKSKKPRRPNQTVAPGSNVNGAPMDGPALNFAEVNGMENPQFEISGQEMLWDGLDDNLNPGIAHNQSYPVNASQEDDTTDMQQPKKRGPKKRNNRPKTQGDVEQTFGADMNPLHQAVFAPTNTPTKQGTRSSRTPDPTRTREMKAAQSAAKKSSPLEAPASTATPIKLYAGPTFHASPAPSSLPLPKLYSKSAPPPDSGLATKPKTSNELSEDSSGSAQEESPTMKNSLRVEAAQPREPSPLDVFFKADREEKARRATSQGSGTPSATGPFNATGARNGSGTHFPNLFAQSARAHSRHPTGGSIFPMELEGGDLPKTPNE